MRAEVSGLRHAFAASNGYRRGSVTAIHATGVGGQESLRIPNETGYTRILKSVESDARSVGTDG